MLHRIYHLVKFWIQSSNQHGIHSPFVFQYVTKCLYQAPNFKTTRSLNIFLKTIAYFKLNQIQLVPDNTLVKRELKENLPQVFIADHSSELIFISNLDEGALHRHIVQNSHLTNDAIIYVDDIYKSAESLKLWNKIKKLDKVTVTIDLFYGGLIFFRKEQVKEHFKIRI